MRAHELRQKYLEYFTGKGHLLLPSAPLEPVDALGNKDETTLFTSAGMQQFKPYFTGEATPPSPRVTTVQKCLRTVDIDGVGDYSHCTFFEMLGNFSFGDYFKAEVIPWTWEFLTGWLKIDPERLSVTVFEEDQEAYDIWRNVVGLPEDRIHRLGEDKNYWPANAISEGPDGPCGPCSEIYYRVALLEEMTSDPNLTPTERFKIDDEAGRYVEIWNNVFTQFDRSADERGKPILTPLPKKNNDTGAGFDRIVMVLQDKKSVFETDLFAPILEEIEKLSGKTYRGTMEPVDFALRVVAEHTRAVVFCIADGILPSNESRGYILRYLIRRAVRYGKTVLGFDEPFLYKVAPKVIEQMGDFYTELKERKDLIVSTIRREEEQFLRTLENGIRRLQDLLDSEPIQKSRVLPGRDAFVLYSTYGFPLMLTEDIAREQDVTVDLEGYGKAMEEHAKKSKDASEGRSVFAAIQTSDPFKKDVNPATLQTDFVGYEQTVVADAKIVTMTGKGADGFAKPVDIARPNDRVTITLDKTPFYAEAGGQVGDTGWLTAPAGDTTCALRIDVTNTTKAGGLYLHDCVVSEGEVSWGQTVRAAVDVERRRDIMRNHTATHLLHAALRHVLGTHVHQKGSLVAPDRLRFDFTHNQAMTPEEIKRVESIVNTRVLEDESVVVHSDVPIAEAKKRGAMALFGEKYGDRVRMIEIPDFSLELCGGTHLSHTSQVGLFKITSEGGVASGVRRIEAVTGRAAYAYVKEREETLAQVAHLLRSNPRDVLAAAEKAVSQRAQLEKQVQQLKSGAATEKSDLETREVAGIAVVTGSVPNADNETLAALADRTAQKHGSAIVVVGGATDGKVQFSAKVTADLVKRGFHAGNLVREVAKIAGGGGGGRPDFAQAGGRDPGKLNEALAKVPELVAQQAGG